ncbi:MAG: hypothetical protein HC888_09325 [Candidatus Competibacteraceae bacterium]|nr:hypothetical protein [Candidatus Competibacteraceae bacterium]
MLTVREIAYKIITDSREFKKGFSEANQDLEEFKENVKAAETRLDEMAKYSAVALTAVGALAAVAVKFAVDFGREFSQVETSFPEHPPGSRS